MNGVTHITRIAIEQAMAIERYRQLVHDVLPAIQLLGTGYGVENRTDGHAARAWLLEAQRAGLLPDRKGHYAGPVCLTERIMEDLKR